MLSVGIPPVFSGNIEGGMDDDVFRRISAQRPAVYCP
jgi:hypothetical protein